MQSAIDSGPILALMGRQAFSDVERDQLSLPAKLGGLGMIRKNLPSLALSNSEHLGK